jgi:sensor histidine kinase regulating citrate/malate metabolism
MPNPQELKYSWFCAGALRIGGKNCLFRRHVQFAPEHDPGDLPSLRVERHKMLRNLVNPVRNAQHACVGSPHSEKRLTVRIHPVERRVRNPMIGNGVAIPPENLTRIFSFGLTTRKGSHGFGLHSGALAAKEMGGALLAESGGRNWGATLTLELPLNATS